MSGEDDKQSAELAGKEQPGPLAGERLAEARREQQISVLEIAKELHLDEPKVLALERNEFDAIGAPVFAKGHLKKYAQLVGVDEGDVLKDYYELNRSASAPPVISARARPRREMSPGPWIAVIVVIIIVASVYWWLTSRPATVSQPEPEPEQPAMQQDVAPVQSDDTAALMANESDREAVQAEGEQPAAEEPRAEEPAAEEPAVRQPEVEQSVVDEGSVRLSVTYSGDCWTEITDASGRRLFFDLGKAGRTVELSGEPPFNVLFGNADNVSLKVDGADYAVAATDRRGRTARLTISGT